MSGKLSKMCRQKEINCLLDKILDTLQIIRKVSIKMENYFLLWFSRE